MIKKIIFTTLTVFFFYTAFCIKQFKHLNLEQGLSGATIECFCQDSKGYLWIGSDNGLNKYDGYRFTCYFYNKTDTNSLQNNEVLSLLEGPNSQLFIGTGGGLQLYNPVNNNFITIPFQHKSYPVRTMLKDKKGNIWIGTYGAGLCLYSTTKKIITDCSFESLKHKSISSLYEDKLGNVWVGTESSGIFLIDRNSGTLINIINNLLVNNFTFNLEKVRVSSFAEDSKGNIWVSLYGKGMFIINSKDLSVIQPFNCPLQGDFSQCSQVISDNNYLWMAFDGTGVLRYNTKLKKEELFRSGIEDPYSLSSNAVKTLFIDKQSNLWIGTFGAGINVKKLYSNLQFKIVSQQKGNKISLPNNNVTGVAEDKNGCQWISTDGGGVCRYNEATGETKLIHPQGIPNLIHSNALCIAADYSGFIWVGYYRGGFISIDPNTLAIKQYVDNETSISQTGVANDIRTITPNSDGSLWIGTNGQGLFLFHPQKGIIKRLVNDYSNKHPGLTGNYIRSVFEDSKGFLWIGTTYGLTRYNSKNDTYINFFEERTNTVSLVSNCIFDIYENSDGNIYIATTEGLSILEIPVWSSEDDNLTAKEARFKNYTVLQELPDKTLYSILEDDHKNIWFGTGKGLAVFNPQNREFRNYPIEERITDVFNVGACNISANDKFYFGTVKGLVYFYPDSVKEQDKPVSPIITSIKINYELINRYNKKAFHFYNTNELVLNYTDKSVNIEFSSLEMYYSDEIKYQYKLDGFDKDWNTVNASQRYAIYTNLNPGNYTFLLRSTNVNGVWGQAGSIRITVKPPFWRSWWFITLVILISAIVLYFVYITRIKAISLRNQKLEQQISERTSELVKEREIQKRLEQENSHSLIYQKELEAKQLKTEKELIRLKNEKLQYEIEKQSAEMERKNTELVSMAVQITQQLEFLAQIKQSLTDALAKTNPETETLLNALIVQIEKDTDKKKDWEQFEQLFNQANNNFFKILQEKFPELTPLDLRMCAYLRMNLSNKEIASLQSISLRGVEKSRSRLRKKLDLENDENIIGFLINIS